MIKKNIEDLNEEDLKKFRVWKFNNNDEKGETIVSPVIKLPVENLDGKIIGCSVLLANKTHLNAALANVDIENPRLTKHFLTISIFFNGNWFPLARYHDVDAERNGPLALSKFLGLDILDIFPIVYDIRDVVRSSSESLVGEILAEPEERLTHSELITLALL